MVVVDYRRDNFLNMRQILWIIFIICIIEGCSKKTLEVSPPYKALVLIPVSVNQQTQQVEYAIKEGVFNYLDDLDSLDGKYLKYYKGGYFKIESLVGSVGQIDSFEQGQFPDLKYKLKNGVVIPQDYISLVLLSSYYQFESILYAIKNRIGIEIDSLLNNKKIEVFFEPKIFLEVGDSYIEAIQKLNAAYLTNRKQFILFHRSKLELIPLAANKQVLAHEFGHLLFEFSFYNNQVDEQDRFSNDYAISGINEGWADFTSFVICGSANVMSNVTNKFNIVEERFFSQIKFTYDSLLDNQQEVCTGMYYCIGSLFAKSLYQAYEELKDSGVSIENFYYSLFDVLSKTQATLKGLSTDILPEEQVSTNGDKENLNLYDVGKVLGAFFYSVITNLPTDWKSKFCKAFRDNFNKTGFPDNAYSICE